MFTIFVTDNDLASTTLWFGSQLMTDQMSSIVTPIVAIVLIILVVSVLIKLAIK